MTHHYERYPDDKIPLNGAVSDAAKAKRHKELGTWFDRFIQGIAQSQEALKKRNIIAHQIRFAEDGVDRVNAMYWEVMVETVKPRITPSDGSDHVTADRHKICSLTELIIIHEQPIEHDDATMRARLNALLAYFCAQNIMGNWDQRVVSNLIPSPAFSEAHLAWLASIAPGGERLAIFSNSATWYLIEELLLARHDIKPRN